MTEKNQEHRQDIERKEELIAPCGMNCALCISYQFKEKDLNKKGFHRTYCCGCIKRGKNCTHMGDRCELLGKGKVRFCFECEAYPCKLLKALDKRYRTKYHMSMIENLDFIKENGIEEFLKKEEIKWKCPECSETICCHNGLCLNCNLETFLHNKKYRWNEEEFQMSRKAFSAAGAATVGPYSHAIESGDLIFLSGQTPIDSQTGKLVEGDIVEQTRQCFKNLFNVLEAAGLTSDNVEKVNVFLTDMNDFAKMNEVYSKQFSEPYPARTTIGVASLPLGAQIEIEMIARRK